MARGRCSASFRRRSSPSTSSGYPLKFDASRSWRADCIIHQREIGAHATSFAEALKSAGREDPGIILVGEMRDRETIALALSAALEILFASAAIGNMIREGKTQQITSSIQTGIRAGMIDMDTSLKQLHEKKLVTTRAAYDKAIDKEQFRVLLAAEGGHE